MAAAARVAAVKRQSVCIVCRSAGLLPTGNLSLRISPVTPIGVIVLFLTALLTFQKGRILVRYS